MMTVTSLIIWQSNCDPGTRGFQAPPSAATTRTGTTIALRRRRWPHRWGTRSFPEWEVKTGASILPERSHVGSPPPTWLWARIFLSLRSVPKRPENIGPAPRVWTSGRTSTRRIVFFCWRSGETSGASAGEPGWEIARRRDDRFQAGTFFMQLRAKYAAAVCR